MAFGGSCIDTSIFRRVEDVDLYPAAVSEKHVPGGIVGPTFACIIARQFRNLKVGDRFWYERSDPTTGFSLGKLNRLNQIHPESNKNIVSMNNKML